MPKERFHLLAAEETLRLRAAARKDGLGADERLAFLLGAILPDAFFYDLPAFRLAPVGRAAHAGDGARMLAAAREAALGFPSPADRALALGVAHHFLTDAFWHPIIDEASGNGLCGGRGFVPRACHFFIESELEGRWTAALGPADGYAGLFRELRGPALRPLLGRYREMLLSAGLPGVPGVSRIGRALSIQTRILSALSHRGAGRLLRPALLRHPRTRTLGALMAPPGGSHIPAFSDTGAPGDPRLLARAVLAVTAALDGP